MIRPATLADVPALVELGRLMHGESPAFSRLTYSPEKVAQLVERLIELEGGFCWVGVRDGEIVGAFLLAVSEHWMSTDRIAGEITLFVEPSARGAMMAARLVAAGVAWAEQEKAKIIYAGVSTGVNPERTAQFYERCGFERSGAIAVERML